MASETEEQTAVVAVDPHSGEVLTPDRLPAPTPRVGGLPIFRLEQARELRQHIDQYQADYLRDEHFYFYASWLQGNRRKRWGYDTRAAAEAEARKHTNGQVEPIKKKIAYEILAMPLTINSEPLPDRERIRGCYAHGGDHPVFTEFWRASTPDGRYAVASGTVAGCEKVSAEEEKILFGGRQEHDVPATAEARAYVRAMRQLLGFGEPAPYTPGAQPATGAHTPTQPAAPQEHPEDVNAAWARLAAHSKQLGYPDWNSLHDFFHVPHEKGTLGQLAKQRAREQGVTIMEAIATMAEEITALPEDETPPEPAPEEDLPPPDYP